MITLIKESHFFLPNMTWIQPPGYIHSMITQTWADQALTVTWKSNLGTTATPYAVSAQKLKDNSKLYVRAVNNQPSTVTLTVTITGMNTKTSVNVWTLSNTNLNAANTPSQPTNVSPVQSTVNLASGGGDITLPVYSFVVLEFQAA